MSILSVMISGNDEVYKGQLAYVMNRLGSAVDVLNIFVVLVLCLTPRLCLVEFTPIRVACVFDVMVFSLRGPQPRPSAP